jgi:heat shock protein HslJ
MEKKMIKKYSLTLLLIALALSACSSQSTQQPIGQNPGTEEPSASGSLIGVWKLTAYGPADAPIPAVEGVEAGLSFSEDGMASGTSGCNGLGGDYTVEGDQITFGEFVSTLMACDPPIMEQEDAAHKVMSGTATYTIEGETLTITNNDMVLVFTRGFYTSQASSEAAPLFGTWKLTSYGVDDTRSSALADVEAIVTFNEDGTVTGTSGCNEFGGSYRVDGNEIEFLEIVSTLKLCDTPLMGQEEAMYQVLSELVAFDIEGNTLTIIKNGMVLIFER